MWLLATSTSADLIHMLKAALICQYCLHVGCRDRKGSGGEGFLNRNDAPPGPYYAYIVEPEQTNTVGWGECAGLSLSAGTLLQGLVTVPFWRYWTSPYSSHYRPYT